MLQHDNAHASGTTRKRRGVGKELSTQVEAALAPVLAALQAEPDPFARIELANFYVDALRQCVAAGAGVRRTAVKELRQTGMTLRAIAERTGLTPARIGQIEQGLNRLASRQPSRSSA